MNDKVIISGQLARIFVRISSTRYQIAGYPDSLTAFLAAIRRAIYSCQSIGNEPDYHFRGVTKMTTLGSGAERPFDDFILTRYACYLIAQNGDSRKEPIALRGGKL